MAGRPPTLQPESQFPGDAIQQSVQEFPTPQTQTQSIILTLSLATAADVVAPWGQVYIRDRQLRQFWPTETFLAGTVAEVGLRNASYQWEIRARGDSNPVEQAVSEMLHAALAGDSFGWIPFIEKFSQDFYTQDNGAFVELIRDEGTDANSRFRGPLAPVLGIGHLDSNRCQRTGNPETPVYYTDRNGTIHALNWYQVIPMAAFPSAIETMNGVGYCAVTRVLRAAQIMRSIALFKDEKISGRHFKSLHLVSGVSRTDIDTAKQRGREEADNMGQVRYIEPVILASLDPEKPVSTATIDLANLPDGFDFDQEMRWYITALSLGYNVDYQQLSPLSSGNIGSSAQSSILYRKSSGKSPVRKLFEAFKNYGVLPRGCDVILLDQNEEEEMDKQAIRTKAMEEYALAIRNFILTPEAVRADLVRRNIYPKETIAGIPADYGMEEITRKSQGNQSNQGNVGQVGGNTMMEDNTRQNTGAQDMTTGDQLRKEENAAS